MPDPTPRKQQTAFSQRKAVAALAETPCVLRVDGAVVSAGPAEWNALLGARTLRGRVGTPAVVLAPGRDCAARARGAETEGAALVIFISEHAAPIGYGDERPPDPPRESAGVVEAAGAADAAGAQSSETVNSTASGSSMSSSGSTESAPK